MYKSKAHEKRLKEVIAERKQVNKHIKEIEKRNKKNLDKVIVTYYTPNFKEETATVEVNCAREIDSAKVKEEQYTQNEVKQVLKAYDNIHSQSTFYTTKLDLDTALKSKEIEGVYRQLIFCLYYLNLNYKQTAYFLDLDVITLLKLERELLEQLTNDMNNINNVKTKEYECILSQNFKSVLHELKTKHVNPFSVKNFNGLLEQLSTHFADDLATNALAPKNSTDTRDFTENNKGKSIFKEAVGVRKTAETDEFYRQDLTHSVFSGDDSLLIADLDANKKWRSA